VQFAISGGTYVETCEKGERKMRRRRRRRRLGC
jgi:hypothetical protein